MCGIIGYVGNKHTLKVLLNGLSKLEYRGYDSAGIAIVNNRKLKIVKSKGKLENLLKKTSHSNLIGGIGIGHTRWATHGEPSDINSHPHFNKDKTITIVHNGIIENYLDLKKELINLGYEFITDTDSEVIVHLLDYYKEEDFLNTIKKTINRLDGSYALGILNVKNHNTLYAVRSESPLIIGVGDNEYYVASDAPAILEYTKDVYYLNNNEIAILNASEMNLYNKQLDKIDYKLSKINWGMNSATKGGYKHFMLKEIVEQPSVIKKTIESHLKGDLIDIEFKFDIKKIKKIYVLGCGTAYHAALNAKYLIEDICNIPVEVDISSEYRYRNPAANEDTLVIIISQSGETADTLAALRLSKEKGAKILSIVNVVGSTIARESDDVIYTWAGPEIAVASTKAFTTQLSIVYLLVLKIAININRINIKELKKYLKELKMIPDKAEEIIKRKEEIRKLAKNFYKEKDVYYLGRGLDYNIAMEGALKLKEISYIHAEAYAAGELKHGTIALIEKDTLVVALCTVNELLSKMISNVKEVKTRGAKTLIISNDNIEADYNIIIPKTNRYFQSILTVLPLQLLAYYIADYKKCDIDKPKNLAKSVTVE